MDFFEKAQARAHAQEVLGLTGHPSQDEIRAAYKKLAREKHPDQREGTDDELARINIAYSLLKKDRGYTAADLLHPAPNDAGATSIHPKTSCRKNVSASNIPRDGENSANSRVAPRRMRTAMTSRIVKVNQADTAECRTLLDEIPYMAEPDPDEISLRARILRAANDISAPYIPHTNHLPYAIRQSGRHVSYMVRDTIKIGANRVAVPTGALRDNRKAMPIIVRFRAEKEGAGTHVVSSAKLADSFPGAKCVRVHFGLDEWPKPARMM